MPRAGPAGVGAAAACLVAPRWAPGVREPSPEELILLMPDSTLRFGRDKTSDVVLEEQVISHNHFVLTHNSVNNEITIKDMSKRGTFLNNTNLAKKSASVREGDVIRVEQHEWTVVNPKELEAMMKNAAGQGKVRNSKAVRNSEESMEANATAESMTQDTVEVENTASPKPRGGILATPIAKIRGILTPKRSSSAVSSKKIVEKGEAVESGMNRSIVGEENSRKSPGASRRNSISTELEDELQHNAKKQPSSFSNMVTNVVQRTSSTLSGSRSQVVVEQKKTVKEGEEVSAASLVVSPARKIQGIYSSVLEANLHRDVPTLENLTTDTIHSVIKCAADANENFQRDLNMAIEKASGLSSKTTEASALYEAVSQGKGFPFASSRILRERVRYCAQLEARLKDHQILYEDLLKSRDVMAKKLESVRISCSVARSIVEEYEKLYKSVYERIGAEIPRPVLERDPLTTIKRQRIVLTEEEVKEITRAIHLGDEEPDEELNGLLGEATGKVANAEEHME